MNPGAPVSGSCFGFDIRSQLQLRYLRSPGSIACLDVTQGDIEERPDEGDQALIEWGPPEAPFEARLYAKGQQYLLWIGETGWFLIDPVARRIVIPFADDQVRLEERLWGIPALLCFLARGDHGLHAAAVEVDGKAIALAGPQRFGKTTLAAALTARGHRLLSEDLLCARLGDSPSAIPGPAMLRVRSDMAPTLGLPAETTSASGGRIHLAIDPAGRGNSEPVPLQAILILRAGEGDVRLEEMNLRDAIADLWALSFRLPDDKDRARCFEGVGALAATVDVFNLHRRMRVDEMDAVVTQIESLVRG